MRENSIATQRKKLHLWKIFFVTAVTITVLGFIYFITSIIIFSNNSIKVDGVYRSENIVINILLYVGIGVFVFICFLSIFARFKYDKTKKVFKQKYSNKLRKF